MSPCVGGLVLFSAVLYASWNALLKSGGDRLRSVTVMAVSAGLASAGWVCFLPAPLAESWFYIVLSVVLHVAYYFLLVTAYRHRDRLAVGVQAGPGPEREVEHHHGAALMLDVPLPAAGQGGAGRRPGQRSSRPSTRRTRR